VLSLGLIAAAPVPGQSCGKPGADCFVLTSLTIDGVTAYPLRDLAPLYADYLAREISQEDLVRIAQAITDKYRSDGYFLSRAVVPPQGPQRGQARIFVYEGYVGEVEVVGDAAPAFEALLGGLAERRPLRLADSSPSSTSPPATSWWSPPDCSSRPAASMSTTVAPTPSARSRPTPASA
jgi:hemolysin activation/secretion protein